MLESTWPFRCTLAGEHWMKVSIDYVHLAFLTAKFRSITGTTPADASLVATPDLENATQNLRRQELLYSRRGPLLRKVPSTTEWFEVHYLQRWHLHQLRAIDHRYWTNPAVDDNELLKVARRMRISLLHPPGEWAAPILWGHTRKGPLTVLEGNNRLVAYAAIRRRLQLGICVYVGLSEEPCCWHVPDRL